MKQTLNLGTKKCDLILLAEYDSPATATIVKSKLEANGIPCFVNDQMSTGMRPILNTTSGRVRVMVNESDLEKAKDLIDDHTGQT